MTATNRLRIRRATVCTLLALLASASCGDDPTGPAAFGLRFFSQPTTAVAGIAQTVRVELLDADGNRMATARDRITLRLTGSTDVQWFANAVDGLATFDDVNIEIIGASHTLEARLAQLAAVSLPFTVAPAGPSEEHTTVETDGTEFESNTPFDLSVVVRDAFGNGVVGASVSVSAPGAVFTPAAGTSGAAGVFTTSVRAQPGSLAVTATVNGAAFQFAPTISIADACAPRPLVVPGSAGGAMAAGAGCVIEGRATRIYTFSVTQEGGVTFAVTPGFEMTYEVRHEPDRPQIAFRTEGPAAQEWLLLPGTYQFRVGAVSGAGNYSFVSTSGPGNSGQDWKVIVRPGTYTSQSLATSDLYDGTWYSDLFLFGDIRPCTITVRSTAFDAYLLLFEVLTGGSIGNFDGGAEGTDARAVRNSCLTIPSQIPLMISPSSAFPDEVGPYTLIIEFTGTEPDRVQPPLSALPALSSIFRARD